MMATEMTAGMRFCEGGSSSFLSKTNFVFELPFGADRGAMNRKILVTGGTGGVGRFVVRSLLRNKYV